MKKWILLLALSALPSLADAQTCAQADLTHPVSVNAVWTDNAGDETGFVLERKLNNGAYAVIASGIGANITALTDATVVRGTVPNTYTYKIKATKTGAADSAYSNEACITFAPTPPPPPTPPLAPSGFTVSQTSSSSIQASWSDNSDNETIFRVDLASFSPPRSFLRTVGANVTSLLISGLQKNKTYCGKIVALNLSAESDPSNQSCTTTAR